eukprot:5444534-Pyramimonas_sp.AAC.1
MARTATSTSGGKPNRRSASRRASGITLSDALPQPSASKISGEFCDAQGPSKRRRAEKMALAVPCSKPNCARQILAHAPAAFKRCRMILARTLHPACRRQIGL